MKESENVKIPFSQFSAQNAQKSPECGECNFGVNALISRTSRSLCLVRFHSLTLKSYLGFVSPHNPHRRRPSPPQVIDGHLRQPAGRAESRAAAAGHQQERQKAGSGVQ